MNLHTTSTTKSTTPYYLLWHALSLFWISLTRSTFRFITQLSLYGVTFMVKVAVQSNHPISKCQRRSGKRFKIPKVNSDTQKFSLEPKFVHECCAKRMNAQTRVLQLAENWKKKCSSNLGKWGVWKKLKKSLRWWNQLWYCTIFSNFSQLWSAPKFAYKN